MKRLLYGTSVLFFLIAVVFTGSILWPKLVKTASAACNGTMICGTPKTTGCHCDDGTSCYYNGSYCKTSGTFCHGCTIICVPNGTYVACSIWNYAQSTCTAVKTNCQALGTCVVNGPYPCNWCNPVNGGWSAWSACRNGAQTRTCTNPAPSSAITNPNPFGQ